MDVGVYFDLRNPAQWRQNPSRLYGFTIEACQEAERLGASSAWFSEHHLFDDDYLTSPLTMAAAVAARTQRMRLGTAILIAPLRPAAEIAEQSVVVDLVSDGRLDLGIGTGYRVPEFELFGASLKARYRQTDDTARRLRDLFGPGGVRPRPVQDPMPIWLGYQGPQGARRAGLLGERLLSADAALWEPYSRGLAEAGHPVAGGMMAGGFQGWATDDPERDWPLVSEHLAHQLNSYRRHMVEGTDAPVPKPVDVDRLISSPRPGPLGSFSYGTPEHVAEQVRAHTAGAPVSTVFLWASIGGMPDDAVMRNIHTICIRLAPLLRAGSATDRETPSTPMQVK
ncbi:LLM class flavin-dependent oxidoreductase [Mycobacterium branderi]|uniref:Flavin-dependent oxidoreductase n=1 Tax=Mycobacterium branderi TaxID=43348 RepID=A0AA91LS90_9MYCO|nr:LLM class flavin-dependent oxidoreductase [Mycobacterium branderi]MCV7235224.1 LLM class flavin-dependent oxidoreductase [Mycobacterium branderi]ORA31889.1 flavin-dependent oxidoreductase [Mycobacterium branderi]